MITLITALLALAIVWGGFAFFLYKAIKFERKKEIIIDE